VSMGDLTVVAPGSQRSVVVPVPGVPSVGGTSQGTASIEVVGAGPQLGEDVGSLLQDLVIRGTAVGAPESDAPGDAVPAPESSGGVGLGASGLYLSSSPGFLPPPINWRRVGDKAESACSRVTAAERLHDTLALVDQNILRSIQVSLKR
jgi:hypothetical protein